MTRRLPLAVTLVVLTAGCASARAELAGSPVPIGGTAVANDEAATGGESGESGDTIAVVTVPDDHQPAGEPAPEPIVVPVESVEPVPLTVAEQREVEPMAEPLVGVGTADGPETARAQQRLLDLGFWLEAAEGEYGTTTSQAVMAFQKYAGLETDGVLGPVTAEALSNFDEHPTGRSTAGTLVEIDKSKQLLFIVQDGVTRWILNTSTGSEEPYEEPDQNSPGELQLGDSVTRTGMFAVNREREEGWWEGDLGEIYRPKYFDGGIALHGSYNVPDYPASHGCVRLSIPAMDWIWETGIVPKGTPVWVHGEIPTTDA
jgi:hypothetical protein